MLCDGDRLIVVAGYHHSGTSILQAQLARRLGLPVPSFNNNDGLRRWQVRQPVYAYERSRFAREGGALVPLLRSLGDCARVRAMPPLSLGERKALSRNNCSGGGTRAKFPADLLFPSVRRPRGGY